MSTKNRVPLATYYVCLNRDRGAVLAYGTIADVQAKLEAMFGVPVLAALQVTEEVAKELTAASWHVVTCP